MEKKLNFSQNYNGKLYAFNYFTTIRSPETIEEKGLKVGDTVEIQRKHHTMFSAVIVSMEKINLDNLSESQKTILMLDYGCGWELAAHSIAHICNGKDVVIITFMNDGLQ